jgi:predicted SPOUT superfamily RNA methylase MTH1
MKTFKQFILEAYDPEIQGRSQIRKQGQGGRIGAERKKTEAEKRRMKAGTNTPVKSYKPRKDIGTQRPRSTREQQPTQARGSAAISAKEAQKKAYLERKAKERGAKTKSASELLAKKPKAKVDPRYKPTGGPGNTGTSKKSYTEKERKALYKKGERTLRDMRLKNLGKTKESELKYKVTSK